MEFSTFEFKPTGRKLPKSATVHSSLLTRRSAIGGLAGILAAGVAPSLCAAVAGGYRRDLGMRMAAMGGEGETPKPYDVDLNWIKSSGTQFLNTGISVGYQNRILIRQNLTSGNFGSIDSSDVRFHSDSIGSLFRIGNVDETFPFPANSDIDVDFDLANLSYKYKNHASETWTSYQIQRKTLPTSHFYLFARNFLGNITSCVQTVHSFKIFNDDELTIDATPVLATFEGNQEACFYNKAYTKNGLHGLQFYRNGGSGSFIYG